MPYFMDIFLFVALLFAGGIQLWFHKNKQQIEINLKKNYKIIFIKNVDLMI